MPESRHHIRIQPTQTGNLLPQWRPCSNLRVVQSYPQQKTDMASIVVDIASAYVEGTLTNGSLTFNHFVFPH
jgi:hypothetical protein